MKLTYEEILVDPKLLQQILAAARRERARAIGSLVGAAFSRLFRERPTAHRFARQG